MTTVPPHGLEILGSKMSRRRADAPVSARVVGRNAVRGVTMNLELLLFMAFIAAVVGAVLPS